MKRGKTDAVDAEAICEAVTRPTMRFVAVKSKEQLALLTMHRVRQLIVRGPPRREAAEARTRIESAHARLVAGEPFDEVMRALGDEAIAPLPGDPLPLAKLREYAALFPSGGSGHASGRSLEGQDKAWLDARDHRPGDVRRDGDRGSQGRTALCAFARTRA